jgi:SPP1 family predicted phage head-tail adaptor
MDLTNVQGPLGGTSSSSTAEFLETWASVYSLIGTEKYAAAQQNSLVSHKITIRYTPGIFARQKVLFDDRYFDIESVIDPDGKKKMLDLNCIERNDSTRDAGGGGS